MIVFEVKNNSIKPLMREILTTGSVNANHCHFDFNESWDELTKIAIFKIKDLVKEVALPSSNECYIPCEIYSEKYVGNMVYAGIYGSKVVEFQFTITYNTNGYWTVLNTDLNFENISTMKIGDVLKIVSVTDMTTVLTGLTIETIDKTDERINLTFKEQENMLGLTPQSQMVLSYIIIDACTPTYYTEIGKLVQGAERGTEGGVITPSLIEQIIAIMQQEISVLQSKVGSLPNRLIANVAPVVTVTPTQNVISFSNSEKNASGVWEESEDILLTLNVATIENAGLMSAEDKTKLENVTDSIIWKNLAVIEIASSVIEE